MERIGVYPSTGYSLVPPPSTPQERKSWGKDCPPKPIFDMTSGLDLIQLGQDM